MSTYGKVRTANTMLEDKKKNKKVRPDWCNVIKKKSVQVTFSVDGAVSDELDKKILYIKFRYGSISQYINYLLAKDLGLVKEE